MRLRPGIVVLALTAFGALAVGITGAYLLVQYRAAALEAAASRQEILVRARAHVVADEIEALVHEVSRLSRLAEVDLADGNMEPEKNVLRIARRDSALFAIAIVVLGEDGRVLWAEPRDAVPVAPGTVLVGLARGVGAAALRIQAGELAIAAPIAGRGAIAALVTEQSAAALFGPELEAALRNGGEVSLRTPSGGGHAAVPLAALRGSPSPPALPSGEARQEWVEDGAGARWLVSRARVGDSGLELALVQSAIGVEGGLTAPFRRLLLAVAVAVTLAVAGGAVLATSARRLERAELELGRARDLADMGKSAAAIAHEVKNGVNGLAVALDVLAGGKGDPETLRAITAQARQEVARLRDVADDLTLFAAPPRLIRAEVDVAELCRMAVGAVAGAAEEAGVEVALDLPPGGLVIRGDAAKLSGALANLARNGVEAMGPGAFGERLGEPAPERTRRLEISARGERRGAIVELADRGPGIPPEIRPRLFQPFVTNKRTGTGLGLAIARRVVEAHGGRIEVRDRDGGGTIFRVTLPAGA